MRKDKDYSVRLKLIFITFSIMIFSNIIIVAFYAVMLHLKVVNPSRFNPLITATVLLGASILIGTIVTPIFSKSLSSLANNLIKGLKEVSRGNFDIKLDEYPFENPKILAIIKNFNNMVNELNSIETLRSDFISNFSHEFKTPLVSMLGFARLLKDPNTSEEEKKEYIDIIINESNRLSNLASNVLLLSKLQSETNIDTQKFNHFYIDEQLRQSILLFQKEWEDKNIDINLDLEKLKYYGNEELLKQVWINLISNSIKFTNSNGHIEIFGEKVDNKYVIKISDDGIGMNEENLKHIYDKFYQADTSHSTKGNGLGMSIVSEILKICNGEINIESSINKGTTFTILLPIRSN